MADRSRAEATALCSGITDSKPPHTEGDLERSRAMSRTEKRIENQYGRLGWKWNTVPVDGGGAARDGGEEGATL